MSDEPDINSIFSQALAITSDSERREYLDRACGVNAELRAKVEQLLLAHVPSASHSQGDQESTLEVPHPPEQPGNSIGPYKLRERLGAGGMGVVWAAEQKQPLRRKVALKVIKPGMDSEKIIARFEAEREALSLMDHPNIARVLDAGTTDQGRPYFVMELIRGVPITEYCDAHKLTIRERLELFTHVCRAIQHAHQKGIIHRDIKPSNVLVTELDGTPVPKVIDFGVAKALYQPLTDRSVYTGVFQAVGTLAYMSPEQAALSATDVDTRADIYGLGVLLYELLTGSTPFDRQRLEIAAIDEACRIIREQDPPKPSTKIAALGEKATVISASRRTDPATLNKAMRGELDWIAMKALEKDRNRRYDTSLSLAADVRRFLDNEPVTACPPSTFYRLKKYVSRHKTATVSLVAIVAAVSLAVLGVTVGLWRIGQVERNAAQVERDAAREARRRAFEYGINLAYEAWNRGNRNEFEKVMKYLNEAAADQERRGFDWRFLWARLQEMSAAPRFDTTAPAVSLSYHPSGSYLAVGCEDRNVIIRNCSTGLPLRLPAGLAGRLVAFSAHGTYLCVGRTVGDPEEGGPQFQLWRFQPFEKVNWSVPDIDDLSNVVISRDERLLAGVRTDGTIEIREVSTGKLVAACETQLAKPITMDFAPDGLVLAAQSKRERDTIVQLWSVTGEKLDEKSIPIESPERLAFSPNGQMLVSGGWLGARLWDVTPEGLQDRGWLTTEASAYAVAFSQDSALALGCADQTIRVWDLKNQFEMERLLHTSLVSAVAFSPDNETLAAATRDNVVHLWDAGRWRGKAAVRTATHYFSALAVGPHGEVATPEIIEDACVLGLWQPQFTAKRELWTVKKARIVGLAISPDGQWIASASSDGILRLGDCNTGTLLVERRASAVEDSPGGVTCVAFSPDAKTLVSGGDHSELYFWNMDRWSPDWAGYEPQKCKGPPVVTSLAFASNDRLACGGGVTWSHLGSLTLWDLSRRLPEQIHAMECPETVRCVAYSPDAEQIAITYKFSAGIIHVLNAATLDQRFEFQGHSNKVTTLAFTLDGTRLITGSDDGTVRFWDLHYGKPVGTLRVGARVRNLAMYPGGNTLLTLSLDGWIRQWRAAP